jgi:NAD(P)-dependent dehydrogenase (short-subunit alcohol dehydrogenase family)
MIELSSAKLPDYQPQIVNITSISAYTSSPNRADYCISKAGLSMMTKIFADYLAEYQIPVFEIRPGIIRTDMTKNVQDKYDKLFIDGIAPFSRWGLPQDVALCVKSIAKRLFPYSTGQIFDIDGGFHLKRL